MDFGQFREIKEIEIAQIDLRYAHTRIQRPERLCSLSGSIERFGQILPVIVLREGMNSFVLIDGYLRVNAVRRCLRDTVIAEIWECKEEEALVEVLARTHSRKWDLIEGRPSSGSFTINAISPRARSPPCWGEDRVGSRGDWLFIMRFLKTF